MPGRSGIAVEAVDEYHIRDPGRVIAIRYS